MNTRHPNTVSVVFRLGIGTATIALLVGNSMTFQVMAATFCGVAHNQRVNQKTTAPKTDGCYVQAEKVSRDGVLTLVAVGKGCEFKEATRPKRVYISGKAVELHMVDKTRLRGVIPRTVPIGSQEEGILEPHYGKSEKITISLKPEPKPTLTPRPTTSNRYEEFQSRLRPLARAYYQNGFRAADVEDMEVYANELVAMESKKAKVLGYATRALVQLTNNELDKGTSNLKTVQKMLNDNSGLKDALTVVIYQMAQRAYFITANQSAAKVKIEALINQTVQDSTPF